MLHGSQVKWPPAACSLFSFKFLVLCTFLLFSLLDTWLQLDLFTQAVNRTHVPPGLSLINKWCVLQWKHRKWTKPSCLFLSLALSCQFSRSAHWRRTNARAHTHTHTHTALQQKHTCGNDLHVELFNSQRHPDPPSPPPPPPPHTRPYLTPPLATTGTGPHLAIFNSPVWSVRRRWNRKTEGRCPKARHRSGRHHGRLYRRRLQADDFPPAGEQGVKL